MLGLASLETSSWGYLVASGANHSA